MARAVHTAADTGSTLAAHGLYRAAGDLDVSGTAFVASADACAAAVAALSGQSAFGIVIVLDGQLAGDGFALFRPFIILLEARIVAAALQLVFAVQLDGHIAIALDPDSGFALIADVDLQVVEGDVHFAVGGVDGDGMLLRLAGDDGVSVRLVDGIAL